MNKDENQHKAREVVLLSSSLLAVLFFYLFLWVGAAVSLNFWEWCCRVLWVLLFVHPPAFGVVLFSPLPLERCNMCCLIRLSH